MKFRYGLLLGLLFSTSVFADRINDKNNLPSLSLDFSTSFPSNVTFTRADCNPSGACASYFDSTGTMQFAGVNVPRLDTNPSSLASLGLLSEVTSTNGIRNNTGVGAVPGTPGTLPSNWISVLLSGISISVVGTGTESGIPYTSIRFFGTPTATGTLSIVFDSSTGIQAAQNQTWTFSIYHRLIAGSYTNISNTRITLNYNTSGGSFVGSNSVNLSAPTTAALNTQRIVGIPAQVAGATIGTIQPYYRFDITTLSPIDITVELGLPQLEQLGVPTSAIPTSTVAVTRAADFTTEALGSWFNATASTIYASYTPGYLPPTSFGTIFTMPNSGHTGNYLLGLYSSFDTYHMISNSSSALLDTTPTTGVLMKSAIGTYFSSTDNAFGAINGTSAISGSANGILFTPINLSIGYNNLGGECNCWIKQIKYWPRKLGLSELVRATQ